MRDEISARLQAGAATGAELANGLATGLAHVGQRISSLVDSMNCIVCEFEVEPMHTRQGLRESVNLKVSLRRPRSRTPSGASGGEGT